MKAPPIRQTERTLRSPYEKPTDSRASANTVRPSGFILRDDGALKHMEYAFTEISGSAVRAINEGITAEKAVDYLNGELKLRKFSELPAQLCPGVNIRKTLSDAFCEYQPELNRDSIDRKIRNWLSDKFIPEREDIFRICFALGLDIEKTNHLLAASDDCGIHFRNPTEICYAYCLSRNMSYKEALRLAAKLPAKLCETAETDKPVFTEGLMRKFMDVSDEEGLLAFFKENAGSFGCMHNTAYKYFKEMFDLLKAPDADMLYVDADENYSIEKTVSAYLRMNVPLDRSKEKLSVVQKIIKLYWPNETSIKRIYSRTDDVKRKNLLLLYIITEGVTEEQAEDADEGEYFESAEECFYFHFYKINLMLSECGMGSLDPRGVFDWLVLYSIRITGEEAMSDRMSEIIGRLFGEKSDEAEIK